MNTYKVRLSDLGDIATGARSGKVPPTVLVEQVNAQHSQQAARIAVNRHSHLRLGATMVEQTNSAPRYAETCPERMPAICPHISTD